MARALLQGHYASDMSSNERKSASKSPVSPILSKRAVWDSMFVQSDPCCCSSFVFSGLHKTRSMSWPQPFRRHTENTRTCWGYTFEHTSLHLTPNDTQPLKQSYDVLGEQVLARLNKLAPPKGKELPRRRLGDENDREDQRAEGNGDMGEMEGVRQKLKDQVNEEEEGKEGQGDNNKGKRDLYAVLEEHHETEELLGRFWEEVNLVPDWVDWAQIERGQDVFYRYGGACLTGLAYQSLLGGMGAARVVETLARTGGFSTKVARGRLFETTQHILQCTRSLESIQPGGEGWKSTIRVRLLHAAVRQRILDLAQSRPGYYDTEAWGIPINDLDSMATIATFSATLIWISLPRQGLFLRQQEIHDYIALWRYIAHVIGCPTDEFATPGQAKRLMDVLLHDEISPTPTSQILANNIIRSLESQPPGYASADFLIASARWMNGNELADALGLARPSLYYWALMAGQCIFFCVFCYTYRAVPSWDRQKIAMLKRVFWQIVVESKYGLRGEQTAFELKYVPEYSTITEMGEHWAEERPTSAVEGRNLKTFLVAVGILGVAGWVGVRAAVGVVKMIWTGHVRSWAGNDRLVSLLSLLCRKLGGFSHVQSVVQSSTPGCATDVIVHVMECCLSGLQQPSTGPEGSCTGHRVLHRYLHLHQLHGTYPHCAVQRRNFRCPRRRSLLASTKLEVLSPPEQALLSLRRTTTTTTVTTCQCLLEGMARCSDECPAIHIAAVPTPPPSSGSNGNSHPTSTSSACRC
nr:hypothetical protein CFP56_56520 [Quercus suber]